jgi:hypothetical protein
MKVVINSYVECPVKMDMVGKIKQYCHECGIVIHNIDRGPVYARFLDKIFGVKREIVYFHIEGEEAYLRNFKAHLKELAKL